MHSLFDILTSLHFPHQGLIGTMDRMDLAGTVFFFLRELQYDSQHCLQDKPHWLAPWIHL